MAWVAERIAEQRLLWNMRNETAVVAAHPQDMTFEQVMTLIRGMLRRDYNRHRLWLVVDTLLLAGSAVLMPVPGPISPPTTLRSASSVTGSRCAAPARGWIGSPGAAAAASR